MNQISEVVATLIHYKSEVRDTLEYCLIKDKYDIAAFNERKRAVLIELEQPTPLKNIIDHSGENGQKLEKMIRDFYAQVYGDGSTILKPADDGLRVDHAQHAAIFAGVLPIHENVEAMIRGVIADGHKQNLDVAQVEEVNKAEERLYRAVAFLTLTNELVKLFGDYNQARNEAKGEETAASRFIGNDLNAVINNLMSVRQASTITDVVYKSMEDAVVRLVENMTGRRDLPAGKNFKDVIDATHMEIDAYIKSVGPQFSALYAPMINELVASANANQGKIVPDKKPEASAAEPQAVEGEPAEIDPKTGMPKA
jgi:hypothetical protein